MKIVIVEPYLTGSHATWAGEYAGHSRHDVAVLGLKGCNWKWRMHGGAVTLARLFIEHGYEPDLILGTDMVDLTTFLSLTRYRTSGIRTALYFHENQITYPWSEHDPDPGKDRDAHYGFINFTSALAADVVAFNSGYHRASFLGALGPFLKAFPDYNESSSVEDIAAKSHVLSLGVDLRRFDGYYTERRPGQKPLILWNHRWEYDKNPDEFFRALFALQEEGLEFEVAVLGESFTEEPPVFREARARLGAKIVQFGYVRDFSEYASWLWKADIIPVTSIHDFFGASVVHAIYCNTYPLLPNRLAYPEHLNPEAQFITPKPEPDLPHGQGIGDRSVSEPRIDPGAGRPRPSEQEHRQIYEDFSDLVSMLGLRIRNIEETRHVETQSLVRRYDWEVMGPIYDRFFESAVSL